MPGIVGNLIRFIVTADGQPFRDDIVKDEAAMKTLDQSARDAGGSSGGMGLLGSSIMSLLPLLSPLTAAAGGALIGLAGMATTAGAGFVGLGIVAKSNLSDIFAAQKAITAQQTAYNNAVNDKQRQAAMLKAKQAWDSLDTSQQKALMSLQGFQKFWDGFSHSFETPVLNMFTNGLTMAQRLLTLMGPTISAAGGAFAKLEADASKALGSPFWAQFFKWMSKDTASSINSIGVSIGNIMKGLAGMFMAFSPGQKSMEQGLINLTARFAQWGSTLNSNSGFQKFVEYFNTQGPKVMSLLGQLGQLIVNVLVAMAPFGSVLLSIVTAIAKFANWLITLNPLLGELIGAIAPAIGIFKLASAAVTGISTAIGIATTVFGVLQRVFIVGMRLIGLAFEMNPIGLIITAIIAVIALAAFEINKHWTAIKSFLETTWNAIKNLADTVWNAIAGFFRKYGLDILKAITGPIGQMVIFLATHWKQIVADAKQLGVDMGNFFASLGQDALNWGKNLIHMFAQGIQNDISTVENAVSGVANTIKHWLGFHSPSAGLPDSDQWAPNFMKMFAAGLNDNVPLVDTAAQKATTSLKNQHNKRLANQQATHLKAEQQQAKHLATLQKQRQAAAQKAQQQTQVDNMKLQNIYQTYSNTMTTLRQNYAKQAQAIEDQLTKDEQAAMQKYTDAVNQRADQLQSAFGLFAQVTHKTVDAKTLLGDEQDQVNTFEQWTSNLQALTKRGIDQGLLAELQKAGPQAADEVNALESMTSDQLTKYVSLWQQQAKDAHDQAVSELAPMKDDTEKQIEALKASADTKLKELTITFDKNMSDAKQKSLDQIKMLETQAPPAITKAVKAMGDAMSTQLQSMLSQAQSYIMQINAVLSSVGGGLAPGTASMVQNGSRSTSSAVSQSITIQHTTQINAPVYGVNDLNAAIQKGVQTHVVPALQQALSQPARALTGVRV